MPFSNPSIYQGLFYCGRGIEQTHRICYCHTAFTNSRCNGLMRKFKFLGKMLVGYGLFDRVQILGVPDARPEKEERDGKQQDHENDVAVPPEPIHEATP